MTAALIVACVLSVVVFGFVGWATVHGARRTDHTGSRCDRNEN